MPVETHTISISTKGFCDVIDVTPQVAGIVRDSQLQSGVAVVFVSGSTAGVTTIEHEPGLLQDIPELFEKLVPTNRTYAHDATWGDGNGFSHLRAALTGASYTVPFTHKRLLLGTWQQIVVLDFDNRGRHRDVVVQLMGE